MGKWPSIAEIVQAVENGKTRAIDLVEDSLLRASKVKDYKSLITTIDKLSRERAKQIDDNIKKGKKVGRLAGVPFIAKDNFLCFGADTTAASNILKGFDAPYQATAIDLLESEGAICVAKANLDAFAHGSSTENSDFFTTLNPYDKTRVPGGSSGGSAAAVALNIAPFALGTDTGGSIRLPASFCGVVGYKPSYGLVSRSGVIAMASSTDVIGPITNDVADAALVLDVISGRDKLDSTTIERDKASYNNFIEFQKLPTIGIVKEYFDDNIDGQVLKLINKIIKKIESKGYKIKKVSLPSVKLALPSYYILCPAEVSSNLSRYDGQRYGYYSKKSKNLTESYKNSRSEGFGYEAKRRIMIGSYVLSSGYYDAYYKQAQIVRTKIIKEFDLVFKEVDFLISPTAPTTAFKIGQKSDPLQMYLTDILTVATNLTGDSAISLPVGSLDGLPVGMQLIAPKKADRKLLSIAKQVERIIK